MAVLSVLNVSPLTQLLILFGIWCAIVGYVVWQVVSPIDSRRPPPGKEWKLPPGPPGRLLFGNLKEVQGGRQSLADYGEMTTVRLGSRLWVTLNTGRVVKEIYNRRSAVTNERPDLPMVGGLISRDNRSVLLPIAEWTERRRVMHQVLSGTAMTKYGEYQEQESSQLLAEYYYNPHKWYSHHARYSNSVIHRITLGDPVHTMEQKMLDLLRVQKAFIVNLPPWNIWDNFPALAKLPKVFQWWRKPFEVIGKETFEVYSAYWKPFRQKIEAGHGAPSFARDVLTGKEAKYSGSDEDAMYLAIQLIEAGSDTTRLSLNTFIMAMICHPEVVKKARQEIDQICGANAERLPTFADEQRMPYVSAMVKELMRWRPIFDWTPEHECSVDLEFEGYLFPKGTNFVINHHALCLNSSEYPEPEQFKPERWLDGHETDVLHGLWAFGGGRRVCVGYRLAQKSLFINMSRLLYCYDFEAAGRIDSYELNHHLQTEPFPVRPSIRSQKHAELVLRSAEEWDVLKHAKVVVKAQ
ncbi:uncharacterized protein Z520_11682 [Fonsecaea multimorphosa CBS 102226]|uniref:Cytochrome P450 n=1 Tax=Fonsecaea multimorphosa CBS 102226 TaxID=1442371 RepID=A0A0D2K8H6_9EURO|nr:uncharacterized protein Z520_11682 [Fonsecaea multimorphosa CBS 102226]KIX92653.1 hypothetical protein Z520_11682 [Fonsecaea multimorphosa CBS 102226]